MDWLTWLMMRHAHGHWCLTLDADECLIYPHHETRPLPALCEWLERQGRASMGALMLDMYPGGRLSEQCGPPGDDPFETLCWFDAGNYTIRRKRDLQNLWIQGGPRARVFFADEPRRAPTMGKVPLVKWHWRYAYAVPRTACCPGGSTMSTPATAARSLGRAAALEIPPRSSGAFPAGKAPPRAFREQRLYDAYYDALAADPTCGAQHSTRLTGWRQLEALGLMSRGGWP